MSRTNVRTKARPNKSAAVTRRSGVRIPTDIARRVLEGHPWIFSDALMGRQITSDRGTLLDVLDAEGNFVGRAVYDPQGPLVLRVFSLVPDATLGAPAVRHAVMKAAERRRLHVDCGPRACLRVLCGDSEGVPAVNVDRYADYLVISAYSELVESLETSLVEALAAEWQPRGIYLQHRYRPASVDKPRKGAELVHGEAAPTEVVVKEGDLLFAVDVTAPLGSGLFPDMRLGRQALARYAPAKRVLNCFSYAGAFSVVAAHAGAAEVVSVDSAARAHSRARRNLTLNDLDVAKCGCEFVTGDSFATLARFAERGRQFDCVVLDPPTFSTAQGKAFTALHDYSELVHASIEVLAPNGIILAASNAIKLSLADLERAIGRAAGRTRRSALLLEVIGQPPDYAVRSTFPEARYLKIIIATIA